MPESAKLAMVSAYVYLQEGNIAEGEQRINLAIRHALLRCEALHGVRRYRVCFAYRGQGHSARPMRLHLMATVCHEPCRLMQLDFGLTHRFDSAP